MQRLMCLGLEGQPAGELIDGTARIWIERLGHIAPERLSYAFDQVEEHATRWPTPAVIRDAIPAYEHVVPLPPTVSVPQLPVDPEQAERSRQRVQSMLDECAAKLGMPKDAA